jgi:hypothetical protein
MSTDANFGWFCVVFINLVLSLSQDLFASRLTQFLTGIQKELHYFYILLFISCPNKLSALART